jgi:hypothetical protein
VKLLTQNAAIPALQVAAIPAAVCLLGTSLLVRGRGLQLLASSNPANWLTLSRGLLGAGSLVLYYVSIGRDSMLCCNDFEACAVREQALTMQTTATVFLRSPFGALPALYAYMLLQSCCHSRMR